MVTIREYIDERGRSRFAEWFDALDSSAAAKTTIALVRIEHGNFSNIKSVGGGVYECRIDFGPGYRIYFGEDGPEIVVLLGGGTKKHQSEDILTARNCWNSYRQRKARESKRCR